VWPRETVTRFDAFLAARRLSLDAVVVGGTALALLGVVSRQTRDCDILHPELSADLLTAARAFAAQRRADGDPLADGWLNNGPSSLAEVLPEGWPARTEVVFQGSAVTLRSLGRADLLGSKLFALCDRGIDLGDCLALQPAREELREITAWLEERDAHPDWPAHVRTTLLDLGRRLGHGV
jgi:hypothetical protein